MLAFGPIPSRRLGRSLGINNIPPKICSYSCVYCQVGCTLKMQVARQAFYRPEGLLDEVKKKIAEVRKAGEFIDYLTFVPDGEPALDINLGREIDLLKAFGFKIAVITNASLIWQDEVRNDLMKADWVSLKVDAVNEEVWRQVNRPHRSLQLSSILEGMIKFARIYKGELTTETMLVKGLNDSPKHAEQIADFLAQLKPDKAYLSIPIRPPAEKWVRPPDEEIINVFYQVFDKKVKSVEYLIGAEGNAFAATGNVAEDLLSITAVHPMREEAVREFLARAQVDASLVQELLARGLLCVTEYEKVRFYLRKLPERRNNRMSM
ncbi:radical SAM protein [candidate division KSB1 bacterium]|nr:radical SAM protein [bacterium]NUM68451.1 radical SAM protein [candidate division KSB1 bacterium]